MVVLKQESNKEALVTALTKEIHKKEQRDKWFVNVYCSLFDLSLHSLRAENNIAVIEQCHPKVFL